MLTPIQYHILVNLSSEYCYGYSWLTDKNYTREQLKPVIKELKESGFVEYHRGLMDDDGMVAGSGFCLNYKKNKEIRELIEEYESKKSELLKKGGFA